MSAAHHPAPDQGGNPYAPPVSALASAGAAGSRSVSFGTFLIVYAVIACPVMAVSWALFWSLFMSLAMGWPFLDVLVFRGIPAGMFFGLTMTVFLIGYIGIFMRPKTTAIPYTGDQGEFLARLNDDLSKRRYREERHTGGIRRFTPRALIRTGVFDVTVKPGAAEVAVTGPGAVVNGLSKRLQRG
jgi:hypothetical protein